MVPYKNFSYKHVIIAVEGRQNLVRRSSSMTFELGYIFIVAYLLWHETSIYTVSSEGPLRLVASYDNPGKICSNLTRIHKEFVYHIEKYQYLTQGKGQHLFGSFMAFCLFGVDLR